MAFTNNMTNEVCEYVNQTPSKLLEFIILKTFTISSSYNCDRHNSGTGTKTSTDGSSTYHYIELYRNTVSIRLCVCAVHAIFAILRLFILQKDF